MRKYYSVPLLFFFLAAALGLFLRWQFIVPTPGIRYTFFLHAHSHVMFLGWVFNVLYLSFVEYHLADRNPKPFITFFIFLQTLVMAMMISFPIQGYGMFSIIFSTLHTLAVMYFIGLFFIRSKGKRSVPLWFARASLFFFFLSTAGPFSLAFLMANDLGHTAWYNFSIYYYLHFQYNGFFLFGIFSLFFQMLERKQIAYRDDNAYVFGKWMAAACVPAYALSILYAKPGLAFNLIGAAAGVLQLVAIALILRELKLLTVVLKARLHPTAFFLLSIALFALVVKSLLQLGSAHPDIARMAYDLRPVVIAYLHLILLGIVTFFILAWYLERGFVEYTIARWSIMLMFAGFVGSEICLVALPWWHAGITNGFFTPAPWIFAFSIILLVGAWGFYHAFLSKKG